MKYVFALLTFATSLFAYTPEQEIRARDLFQKVLSSDFTGFIAAVDELSADLDTSTEEGLRELRQILLCLVDQSNLLFRTNLTLRETLALTRDNLWLFNLSAEHAEEIRTLLAALDALEDEVCRFVEDVSKEVEPPFPPHFGRRHGEIHIFSAL